MRDQELRDRRREARKRHNREFFEQMKKRRDPTPSYERAARKVQAETAERGLGRVEELALARDPAQKKEAPVPELVLETIVRQERPVLFVESDWINVDPANVTVDGDEAQELVDALKARKETLSPLIPLVGRIDVQYFPNSDYLGTGWFVAEDIVVTNRHVASLIARREGRQFVFRRGIGGNNIAASLGTAHEFDDLVPDQTRSFAVTQVLYIEPENGPHDIAFLRVSRRTAGTRPPFISVAEADISENAPVLVVGYPARASKSVIPDQAEMDRLYRNRYDVKRAAPGYTMSMQNQTTRHDCTTLGGNSGSVVLDMQTGKAVGLHFAGLYQESNYAVRATVLGQYIRSRKWDEAPIFDVITPPAPAPVALSGSVASATFPLTITVHVGPQTQAGDALQPQVTADEAVKEFWDRRPEGVVAARVGFSEEGDAIGEVPFIAASVPAGELAAVQAKGPVRFQGFEVRYFAADVAELADSIPGLEAQSIAYDDDARTGEGFSFDRVEEDMTVTAHVGPEYSWDVLKAFLDGAKKSLVCAIYEFHGAHIAQALEKRLAAAVDLKLVMDNLTFTEPEDDDLEFARAETFEDWHGRFGAHFERIVAPEGAHGLIANAYHIKVTVREDDTFWLSSGNWKMDSSQPVVTQAQRDNARNKDLPGNREWHVVVKSKVLAKRFRNHIAQDFKRAKALGGGATPSEREAPDILVDVPIEPVLERRAPSEVLEPAKFSGKRKVKPLLTPDREGAVYSRAVLELIRSARSSLLFQIPYIGMPSNPRADRGFIDELIEALTEKLKTLPDARVLLRAGGKAYSSPAHAAWYFKSKGVRIQERLRRIEDHHTKGMIVDGKRVLIGSHNWSQPGVTLNRDASLVFDDAEIAQYYARAFEIDWQRSNPIPPKRHTKEEAVLEAVGDAPPPGYRRIPLSQLLKEED